MDTYQTPQAYLHGEGSSEGGDTPPDSQSMIDEAIIDFSAPEMSQNTLQQEPAMPEFDPKYVSGIIPKGTQDNLLGTPLSNLFVAT